MKSQFSVLLLSILICLFAHSCSKDNPVTPDTTPVIESINPAAVYIDSILTINGKNFGDTQTGNFVELNGVKPDAANYSQWSASQIKLKVPAGVSSGKLYVTTNSKKSNGFDFTIISKTDTVTPVITNLTPNQGPIGQTVQIKGMHFGNARGTGYVLFNNVSVTNYSNWSDSLILASVPAGASTGNVIVNVNNKISNPVNFIVSVIDSTPEITSLSVNQGNIGDTIKITGKKFGAPLGSSNVTFNGTVATQNISWTDTQILVKIPTGATSGKLYVNVGTKKSNGMDFTITVANTDPVISSLSVTSGYPGQEVTINGSKFGAAQGIVTFNNTQAVQYNSWSDTQISVNIPSGATSGPITVTVGGKKSNGLNFTITVDPNAPVITALTLTKGQIGQSMKIIGSHFGTTQGSNYVTFNGTKAYQYASWSDTQIQLTIPAGATTGDVVVYVNSKASNGKLLTIQSSFQLLNLVLVPKGNFVMGNDNSSEVTDKPAHTVNITHDFYMSKTEITQKQWGTILTGSNPSKDEYRGDNKPVEQMDFYRACWFCNQLSIQEGYTPCYAVDTTTGIVSSCDWSATGYRLPTEAEWEYACKANHNGDYTDQEILDLGWISDNSAKDIHDAGTKNANAFGLQDMLGNVYEWCWDFDGDYTAETQTDPHGPSQSSGEMRIMRGGSFISGTTICNPTKRDSYPSTPGNVNFNLGFRVVRVK